MPASFAAIKEATEKAESADIVIDDDATDLDVLILGWAGHLTKEGRIRDAEQLLATAAYIREAIHSPSGNPAETLRELAEHAASAADQIDNARRQRPADDGAH